MRPKIHYLYHQAEQIRTWKLNLCTFANWDEESFLGKVKAIGVACHGRTFLSRIYERYIICLALLVQNHKRLEATS